MAKAHKDKNELKMKWKWDKNEQHILDFFDFLVNKFKNHLINLTHGCLRSDLVDDYATGMFLFCFYFGTASGIDLKKNN